MEQKTETLIEVSEARTEQILIRAYTGSEWDGCNYAIFTFDDAAKQILHERMQAALDMSQKFGHSFYKATFWQDIEIEFLSLDEDLLEEDTEWAYIKPLTPEQIEQLPRPENRLDCYNMNFSSIADFHEVQFKCYGKHTSEEFWTTGFPLNM